ncbi:hypothetical protein DPMN_191184 [Dreissena polymorpha]|uniref:Uncharacterized protein n=1 Tax=Dreissena polymorpha TaxID=45954 RepID=A0A9D3XXW1_DREPO|nr:hypothetical protein DPMN_191184 [Dreissena polymorpha]
MGEQPAARTWGLSYGTVFHSVQTLARAPQKLMERKFARALPLNNSLLHELTLPNDNRCPNTAMSQHHGEITVMEILSAQVTLGEGNCCLKSRGKPGCFGDTYW